MKGKIITWWHQCGAFITILLAYAVATGSAIYGVEIARKYNDVFWLVFAIMVGLLISLFIGILCQDSTIEELLKEDANDQARDSRSSKLGNAPRRGIVSEFFSGYTH